jgi:hypothetical protein
VTRHQRLVEPEVLGDHPFAAEPAAGNRAARGAVQLRGSQERRRQRGTAPPQEAGDPVVHQLGVPVASASTITRPNGSAHWIGFTRAKEPPRSSSFSA